MCCITEFVRGAHHRVSEVVDDEDEAAVLRLRDDDAGIFLEHTFLEDEVSAARWHDTVFHLRLVHLANNISVDSRTVHDNLGFDLEFYLFRIVFIDANAANNFPLIVLQQALHLDVVGKRCTLHPWNVIIDRSCEEAIEIHT